MMADQPLAWETLVESQPELWTTEKLDDFPRLTDCLAQFSENTTWIGCTSFPLLLRSGAASQGALTRFVAGTTKVEELAKGAWASREQACEIVTQAPLGVDELPSAVCSQLDIFQIHRSRFQALVALARAIRPGGRLLVYGPFSRSTLQDCELDVSKDSLEFSESYLDDVKKWCPELDVEESFQDDKGRFALVLSSPPEKYSLPGSMAGSNGIQGCAHVVSGFGRGSRELAVPTANLDPSEISAVASLRHGVYCGFARKAGESDWFPMVMNIGKRPSFADGDGVSIEVHIIKEYSEDFYGEQVEIDIRRFQRPEMAFANIQELQLRIQSDIETAKLLTSQTMD